MLRTKAKHLFLNIFQVFKKPLHKILNLFHCSEFRLSDHNKFFEISKLNYCNYV
jgi:hypothetical protein